MATKRPRPSQASPNGSKPEQPAEWSRFEELAGKLTRVPKRELDEKRKTKR